MSPDYTHIMDEHVWNTDETNLIHCEPNRYRPDPEPRVMSKTLYKPQDSITRYPGHVCSEEPDLMTSRAWQQNWTDWEKGLDSRGRHYPVSAVVRGWKFYLNVVFRIYEDASTHEKLDNEFDRWAQRFVKTWQGKTALVLGLVCISLMIVGVFLDIVKDLLKVIIK